MRDPIGQLDRRDYALWLEALQSQPTIDEENLLQWVGGPLRDFYPFDRCLLIHAQQILGEVSITHLLQLGHETSYLEQMIPVKNLERRGSLTWWLHHQRPFVIDERAPPDHTSNYEIEEIRHFGLGRIAAHGTLDIKSRTGTYFSFSGVSTADDGWHHEALQLIAPMLNSHLMAYIRAKQTREASKQERLTAQGRNVIQLLISGKSNKLIARELGIAEQTVKNHLVQIYDVFGVKSRKELMSCLLR